MDDASVIKAMNVEYETWCRRVREMWLEDDPDRHAVRNPNVVAEVDPAGQRELRWKRYIEDVGTAWWRDRGFKLHWPETGTGPCKVERYPFCCEAMARAATLTCNQHDAEECPDVLVKVTTRGVHGLRIHDGGSSYSVIAYCPWCGTKLPDDVVDEE